MITSRAVLLPSMHSPITGALNKIERSIVCLTETSFEALHTPAYSNQTKQLEEIATKELLYLERSLAKRELPTELEDKYREALVAAALAFPILPPDDSIEGLTPSLIAQRRLLSRIDKSELTEKLSTHKTVLDSKTWQRFDRKLPLVVSQDWESVDDLRQIQERAGESEVSFSLFDDFLIFSKDREYKSFPRFREFSRASGHTHKYETPVSPHELDILQAKRLAKLGIPSFILSFGKNDGHAEITLYPERDDLSSYCFGLPDSNGWYYEFNDQTKIQEELQNLGLLSGAYVYV